MAELWDSSCDIREIDDSLSPLFLSTAAVAQYEAFGAIFPISADSYLITPEAELCALKIEASPIITSDGLKPIVFQKLVTSAVGAKIFSPELKGLLFSVLGESSLRGELDFQNRVEHLVIFSQKGIELSGLTIKNVDKVSVISGNFFGYFSKGYVTESELESLAISQFKDDLGELVIKGLNTLKDIRLFGGYVDCEGLVNGRSIDIAIASKTKVLGGGFNNAKCVISAEDFFLSHDTKSRIELDLSLSSKNAVIKSYDEIEYRAKIKVKEELRITGREVEVVGNGLIETSNLFIQASLFESPHPENIIVRDNFTLVLKDVNDDYVGYWHGEKLATVGGLTSIICKYLWMIGDSLTMGSLYLELRGPEESTLNIIYGSNKVILPTMNILGSLTISVQEVDLVLGLIMATGKIEMHGRTFITGYGSTFVSTESSLILESNSFDKKNFYGLFHGGELLQINCFEGINVYGRWSSNQEVYIQSSYVDFYNKDYGLECGGKTTLKVYNFYMEASSKIRSKDLIIENKAGGKLNKLWLKDAVIEVSGDARIRASEVLLQIPNLNLREELVSITCLGVTYKYCREALIKFQIISEIDLPKMIFIDLGKSIFPFKAKYPGYLKIYHTKASTSGSLINIRGFLELDTNKVTLDKSFIKTGKGVGFITPASLHIVGQEIKDRALCNTECWLAEVDYWGLKAFFINRDKAICNFNYVR
jgi:hypothetical protein